jgi:nicotinamide-nucleotide amidase
MNAEILCVGTELLLGDIVNTNAAYLARELAACGISCHYQSVAGDNPRRLQSRLEHALSHADMVIATGGLGPTYDDLTKETVAAYFGLEMELHEPSLERLTGVFRRMGRPMTGNNRKQAFMPRGARVFPNDRGTAPGLAVEGGGKIVIMLPGPPREMQAMFENQVRPYLQGLSGDTLVSRTIHFYGIGESALESELREYMEASSNPTIAPYAKEGEVLLRVTASGSSREEAEERIRPVVEELSGRFAQYVYGVDVGSLQNALVGALRERGLSLSVAENCTGGLTAERITGVGGSAAVFGCSLCAYADATFARLLELPEGVLANGPASQETALAMARAVRKLGGTDIGCAVTGKAADEPGAGDTPVGMVSFAVAGSGFEKSLTRHLARGYGGEREFIRRVASSQALHLALQAARAWI